MDLNELNAKSSESDVQVTEENVSAKGDNLTVDQCSDLEKSNSNSSLQNDDQQSERPNHQTIDKLKNVPEDIQEHLNEIIDQLFINKNAKPEDQQSDDKKSHFDQPEDHRQTEPTFQKPAIIISETDLGSGEFSQTKSENESVEKTSDISTSPSNSKAALPDLVNSSFVDTKEEKERKSTPAEDEIPSYQVKWIKFRNKQCAIITQNVNGPCPLLAVINVLLLKGKINLSLSTKIVTYDQMIVFLANFILENGINNAPEGFQLDYEQNINDAMQLFPKLQTGLDVNVQFNSITSFEYTSEMIIFDLLGISLYHGWIVDQDDVETVAVIGNCSYNQLVDKIITNKSSNRNEEVTEALIAEQFLKNSASQLTYYGLSELASNVREQEICILFRNNHFITLYKNQNQLYQLVTDQGFLHEPDVVWMTLNHIDNDDVFVNHEFKPSTFKSATLSPGEQKKQIDQDFLIALSIEEEEKKLASQNQAILEDNENGMNFMMSDEELARRLQEEEDNREQEEHLNKRNMMKKTNSSEKATQQRVDDPQYSWNNQASGYRHSAQSTQNYQWNSREMREQRRSIPNPHNTPNENHTQSSSSSSRTNRSNSNHNSGGHHKKCIIS